jgi:hypothetical protein
VVLINLCSESVRTQRADVDIGSSVREFLRRLGIDAGGASMKRFRKQMLALSACHMTLAMPTPGGAAQIDAKPIDAFQAWHTDEGGQQALWPGHIRLTSKFFESLMEHGVPLDCAAIGRLQNSALALDVYSWLAHRLWRVREGGGIALSWAALKAQFGQEYRDIKNFKKEFAGALRKAADVYDDARLEIVPGGVRLLPSPPPVKRMAVSVALPETGANERAAHAPALPPPPSPLPARAVPAPRGTGRGQLRGERAAAAAYSLSSAVVPERLVSERALEQVPSLAPGWDKYALAEKYRAWVADKAEMPRYPDAAFLGWVRKYP